MARGQGLSFLQVLWSTLAAAFGVQTRHNMERDFSRGEVFQFVMAGVIFTVIFVVSMIALVLFVVANI